MICFRSLESSRTPVFVSSTTSLDLGYMPEVYYYNFYRVPKSSLITEIPKYIYKNLSFTCLPSSYYHTCTYKITAKRAQKNTAWYMPEKPPLPACQSNTTADRWLPHAFSLAFTLLTFCHCRWAHDPLITLALAYNLIIQIIQ
jgi:hypothetical protein